MGMSWEAFEDSLTPSATGIRHLDRWDAMGLDDVDDAFVANFGVFGTSPIRIATDTARYKAAITAYSLACVIAAKDVLLRRQSAGHPDDKTFVADIKHALCWPTDDDPIPYPFPTRSFVAWAFALFASIRKATTEVSCPIYSFRDPRIRLDAIRVHSREWHVLASMTTALARMGFIRIRDDSSSVCFHCADGICSHPRRLSEQSIHLADEMRSYSRRLSEQSVHPADAIRSHSHRVAQSIASRTLSIV